MVWLGWEMGRFFGWNKMDSLFLGAILSISSTTIIIKAMDELKLKKERFAQMVMGILIVEDILTIAILALLSGLATRGELDLATTMTTMGSLLLFLVISLVVGILTIPRLVDWISSQFSDELLLVSVLGLCFGFCLLVSQLQYSVALGAFVIGAIMAESKSLSRIEHLLAPVRDLFSAVFFVAIGLLLDLASLREYFIPILVITLVVIAGKIFSCGLGSLVAGNDGKTSLRIGMSVSQIGEFSFIIAGLGASLQVTSEFLYPVTVAVSAITTFTTPYLIRGSGPLTSFLAPKIPTPIAQVVDTYVHWRKDMRVSPTNEFAMAAIRKMVIQLSVNACLVACLFVGAGAMASNVSWLPIAGWDHLRELIWWTAAMFLSLPFLVAIYRKSKALGRVLAELGINPNSRWQYAESVRRTISEIIPVLSLGAMSLLIMALSSSILPAWGELIFIIAAVIIVLLLLWKKMVNLHSRLQSSFIDQMKD
jgi:CPA2 family monovalent cation:H+ antiporter-2